MANRGINKAIIVGRLGDAPEIIELSHGGILAKLSVATSESWVDKGTGEQRERTEWHKVSVFGKLAEVAEEYLSKGAQVYIEGQLRTHSWEDDNGNTHYSTEIVVQGFNGVMQMLGFNPQNTQQHYAQSSQGRGQVNQQVSNANNQQVSNANNQQVSHANNQQVNNQQVSRQTRRQSQRSSQGNRSQRQNQQAQYNEPPMDFDDDIPFAFIGLQYPMLLHCCG